MTELLFSPVIIEILDIIPWLKWIKNYICIYRKNFNNKRHHFIFAKTAEIGLKEGFLMYPDFKTRGTIMLVSLMKC